nr:hypothetical protein [Cupriavidus pinatubonensis]
MDSRPPSGAIERNGPKFLARDLPVRVARDAHEFLARTRADRGDQGAARRQLTAMPTPAWWCSAKHRTGRPSSTGRGQG